MIDAVNGKRYNRFNKTGDTQMYTIMQRVDGGEWKKTLACRIPSQREAERLAEKMTRDHNREGGKLYEYRVVKNDDRAA